MSKKSDPRLASILDRSGDPATVAWAHDGQGALAALPDPELAVLAAEKLGNVAALQAVTAPKDLRKAAAAALHRLRSQGVKVEEKAAPAAFTLTAEKIDLPSRAFLSIPDRDGEVELLLTASDQEGSCVLATIVGGPSLVRESRHAHVNRGELRTLWREVTDRGMHAELPFVAGLHYAERLLGGGHHHDWKHFLEHVPAGTLQSARILDPMAKAPPASASEPPTPKWMVPSGLLDPKALQSAADGLLETMATLTTGDDASRDSHIDGTMKAAADAALTDAARARLDTYLELAIAAAAYKGWARHAEEMGELRALLASGVAGHQVDAVMAAVRLTVAESVLRSAQEFVPTELGGAE